MLIALFADVHSNLEALTACLRHARERGAEQFVFLGDLVGYGPDPAAVVDEVAGTPGAIVVKGNHDHAVEVEPKTRDLGDSAHAVIVWTRQVLSAAQRRYLAELPLVVEQGDICYVHASAKRPEAFTYVQNNAAAAASMEAAGRPYVFCGHVHDPALYFKGPAGKTSRFTPVPGMPIPTPPRLHWLAIAGSVGQPRDGNPAASYALFNRGTQQLTYFRIPYDHLTTARRVRAAGLPERLAERLEQAY